MSSWMFVEVIWTSWTSVAFLVEICWHMLLVNTITAMLIKKAMVAKAAYTIIAHSRVPLFPSCVVILYEGNLPPKFVVDLQGTKTDDIFFLTDSVNEQFSEFFLMVSTVHLAGDCS